MREVHKTFGLAALLTVLAFLLPSCGDSPAEAQAKTEASFDRPREAGTLPDGRKIKYVVVSRGASYHDHYIYFVDGAITVNRSVSQGKTTTNQVTVLIDGVEYVRKDAEKVEKD